MKGKSKLEVLNKARKWLLYIYLNNLIFCIICSSVVAFLHGYRMYYNYPDIPRIVAIILFLRNHLPLVFFSSVVIARVFVEMTQKCPRSVGRESFPALMLTLFFWTLRTSSPNLDPAILEQSFVNALAIVKLPETIGETLDGIGQKKSRCLGVGLILFYAVLSYCLPALFALRGATPPRRLLGIYINRCLAALLGALLSAGLTFIFRLQNPEEEDDGDDEATFNVFSVTVLVFLLAPLLASSFSFCCIPSAFATMLCLSSRFFIGKSTSEFGKWLIIAGIAAALTGSILTAYLCGMMRLDNHQAPAPAPVPAPALALAPAPAG
jgi:hypothetical protein